MDTYVFTFLRWRSCTSLPYSLEEGNDRIYTGKSPQIIIAMLLAIPLPSHQTTLKSTENPPGIHSKVSSAAMTPPSGKSPHIITAILLAIPLPSPLPSSFPPGGGGREAEDEGSREDSGEDFGWFRVRREISRGDPGGGGWGAAVPPKITPKTAPATIHHRILLQSSLIIHLHPASFSAPILPSSHSSSWPSSKE